MQINRNRNIGRQIYINASCVQINVLHPKGIRTKLFFQGMQVGDPLLGEVLQLFCYEYQIIGSVCFKFLMDILLTGKL